MEWTAQQQAAIEPTDASPLKIMVSPWLESDCFEAPDAASYRERRPSTITSAPSMLALPNEGDDGFDIGSVEMSEEQRKILDEVLADINALQINQETPEDVPKEFCPEIFIYDTHHNSSNIYYTRKMQDRFAFEAQLTRTCAKDERQ